MAEPQQLTEFFRQHARSGKDEFLTRFPGAFLLGRFKNSTPQLLFIPAQEGLKVFTGSAEECDFCFELDQTLDEHHVIVAYHTGFRGWTVQEETKTSFGTTVDGVRLAVGRPLLLRDRQEIKLGGGLSELQFYTAETLWTRMNKAGITRSVPKKKPVPMPEPEPEPEPQEKIGSHEDFDSEDLGV
jgi:hypothetical protein